MNNQTAPVTMDLLFPITGYLDDGEEPAYEVSDDFVFRYRCEISDIIQEHQERGDGDIAKLADILGHSSINTTRIYIMTTGTEHRRKIERLGLVV